MIRRRGPQLVLIHLLAIWMDLLKPVMWPPEDSLVFTLGYILWDLT